MAINSLTRCVCGNYTITTLRNCVSCQRDLDQERGHMRKHQVSLTLDQALLQIVDARGENRSETIGRDLWDYYELMADVAVITNEEESLP